MRNPLNWRNTASAPYLATYVENEFARANAFSNRPRRNVDPWPTFEWARAERLPMPHLPTLPGAVECYERCWEIAFGNFRRATADNGFVSDYSSTMYDGALFIWDSVFITLFGRYADRAWNFQIAPGAPFSVKGQDNSIQPWRIERDGSVHNAVT
jgi:hypothetical protein